MTSTDVIYLNLLNQIQREGDLVETRNHLSRSSINTESCLFTSTPLITLRKVAWKKALREMEWFMSGDIECPSELLDWWGGQLSDSNRYYLGYSHQFRHFDNHYDQIRFIQEGLRNNPYSRRLILTTWNPADMASITDVNANPNTPTCCHNTLTEFFVRYSEVHLVTVQRSADVLLGAPHNWIQTWAMLMYLARHAGLKVGFMKWSFGDAHIYQEESHLKTVSELLACEEEPEPKSFKMVYNPTSKEFIASDFSIVGQIPDPKVLTRPRLL